MILFGSKLKAIAINLAKLLKRIDESSITQFCEQPRFSIGWFLATNLTSYMLGFNGALQAVSPPLGSIPQYLPISAYLIVPQGKAGINLEVAQTFHEQELGLMYRPALSPNQGMLFQISPPRPTTFWMKNTPVPLDMVFLRNGVIRYIKNAAQPCKSDPCPTYGPTTAIDQVIELRSGRVSQLGLKIGDRIRIDFIKF